VIQSLSILAGSEAHPARVSGLDLLDRLAAAGPGDGIIAQGDDDFQPVRIWREVGAARRMRRRARRGPQSPRPSIGAAVG
jgi:hypothetical protein